MPFKKALHTLYSFLHSICVNTESFSMLFNLYLAGMYVMAVGSLQSGEECPVIVPIKLQDLSSINHAETVWPLEVIDQLNFLNS